MRRGFVDLSTSYQDYGKEYSPKPPPSQPRDIPNTSPSRNDIFAMSHTISKPATKMTSQELQLLKNGNGVWSPPSPTTKESIVLPISNTAVPLPKQTQNKKTTPSFLTVDTKKPDIQQVQLKGPITLSYFPTARNFLGEGRHSRVYKGSYSIDGKTFLPCAVKRLHPNTEAQALGLSESLLLRHLSECSYVIKMLDSRDENDVNSERVQEERVQHTLGFRQTLDPTPRLILVLEYLSGGNLWDWMLNNRKNLSKKLWLKWAREICQAVAEIHACGIVHHDIKPHNILLTDLLDIRLADFGNACFVPEAQPVPVEFQAFEMESTPSPTSKFGSPSRVTPGRPQTPHSQSLTDGLGRGTLGYTAPEMLRSSSTYSFPVDVYSVGVTLFALISGSDPFSLCRGTSMLYYSIQRGFFESGMQRLNNSPADPCDGDWKFQSAEQVPSEIAQLIFQMVKSESDERPTAAQALQQLKDFI
ncbi:kinase-like domain-containing protein [Gorgonomyces haynaldii]|nr:kinase-like domain-containing protein [Gorgonomyces haynaldii]